MATIPFIELVKADLDGTKEKWYWMLYSPHGRRLAVSPGGYVKQSDALRSLEQTKQYIQDAVLMMDDA